MAEQSPIELVKRPYAPDRQTIFSRIISKIPMPVGGREGQKSLLVVRLFPRNAPGPRGKDVVAVAKEYKNPYGEDASEAVKAHYKSLNEKYVFDAIKAYDLAREAGLPVPNMTRYFNDGLPAILMTDLTEGGKYRVWGYNNQPSTAELETKTAMQLTGNDLLKIKKLAVATMRKATKNGFRLRFHQYQVRQRVAGRAVGVVLLDLDESFFNHDYAPEELKEYNETEVLEFFGLLAADIT